MVKYNFLKKEEQIKHEKFEVKLEKEDLEKIDKIMKICITMPKANSIFVGKLVERYMMKYHGIKEVEMHISEQLDNLIDLDIERIRKEAKYQSQQS